MRNPYVKQLSPTPYPKVCIFLEQLEDPMVSLREATEHPYLELKKEEASFLLDKITEDKPGLVQDLWYIAFDILTQNRMVMRILRRSRERYMAESPDKGICEVIRDFIKEYFGPHLAKRVTLDVVHDIFPALDPYFLDAPIKGKDDYWWPKEDKKSRRTAFKKLICHYRDLDQTESNLGRIRGHSETTDYYRLREIFGAPPDCRRSLPKAHEAVSALLRAKGRPAGEYSYITDWVNRKIDPVMPEWVGMDYQKIWGATLPPGKKIALLNLALDIYKGNEGRDGLQTEIVYDILSEVIRKSMKVREVLIPVENIFPMLKDLSAEKEDIITRLRNNIVWYSVWDDRQELTLNYPALLDLPIFSPLRVYSKTR